MSENGRGIQRFEDLVAWQRARDLTRLVSWLTQQEPLSHRWRFCEQFQAAALSVMNNVAESFARNRRAESSQFLTIAKGSCGEVRSMIYVALDAGYIDWATFEHLLNATDELARILAGLRATVDRQRKAERRHPRSPRGQTRPMPTTSKLAARSSQLAPRS
jgi:four helix bundle protein